MFAKTGNAKLWQGQIVNNELILHSIAEGICVVETSGKITYLNSSAAKMFGSEISDLVGRNYEEILFRRDDETENLTCPIRFALSEGEISHVNTETFFRRTGASFLVEYICVPLVENEQIVGAVITFQDITERREIETAIAQARDSALETANTKAAFLANMSHEIRTPLNGIIGTANLLLDSDLNQEQHHYASMLKTSADSLLEIVNDILDFSKIEAGKRELEAIDFDLRQVVENAVNFFAILARKKDLQISFEIAENVPTKLHGDSNQLRQILNNLISNAAKFTETGEIAVQISNQEENQTQVLLHFAVSDTGIGIDEAAQKKLFQPFMQADVSTTRKFGGTGLGLAICKQIVGLMQGEIGVESEPNKGSRFWFTATFQVQSSKFKVQSPNFSDLHEDRKPKTENQLLNILIAEDNPINREITQKMLEYIGFESEIAENGLEAVKAATEKNYDLILMDCQMPEMDGCSAAIRIRQHEHRPKIIALTANAAKGERERCLDAGMDDYLCKPITKENLAETIEKHFPEKKIKKSLDLKRELVQHRLTNIIDAKTLKNFLEIESNGEENFAVEMLEIFCNHTEKRILELTKDVQNRDAKAIRQKAHNLIGSSASIGISSLSNLFENLESAVEANDWNQITNHLAAISQKFENIKREIYQK